MLSFIKWILGATAVAVITFVLLAAGYAFASSTASLAPYAATAREGITTAFRRIQNAFGPSQSGGDAKQVAKETKSEAEKLVPLVVPRVVAAADRPAEEIYAEIVISTKKTHANN